ncbi:maleylpyruvate isomerase family mycothiol-dependent enzyme [Cryptosporangium japonicum]|uniref:Maleylpyruvate isomerase family mycothiol-dependent enzyme n=2 Tax=Cryptosporangium japonicum TaxID=80872 RepID=A0ABN0UEY1_9ACTN
MDDTEVWSAVDRRRRAIVDLLTGLSPGDWNTPSLCEGWRVRDVAAHLTMPLLTVPQMALLALRHPGSTNHLIRHGSIDLARRYDSDQILRRLSLLIGHHRPFPGLTCREALIDAVGHTYDMTIPLGREIHIPADEVAEAADRVVSYRARGNAKVFRRLPLTTVRLTAADHTWSTGAGPEVTGTMTDLFLLLTGRTARIAQLQGPGAEGLRRLVTA